MPRERDQRDERRRPDQRSEHQGRISGRPPQRCGAPPSNVEVAGSNLLGTIDKIVDDKGFGFVTGKNGIRYFFHFSVCLPKNRATFDNLYEGEQVRFDGIRDAKGPRCEVLTSVENPEMDEERQTPEAASAQAAVEVIDEMQGNKA